MSLIISKIDISPEEITALDISLKKNFFKNTATLLYPGQKPVAAIYIHDGQIIVLKRNKIAEIIGPGKLIMPLEFINKKDLRFELVAAASTVISWINLETLQKINF